MATLNTNANTTADKVKDIVDTHLSESIINAFINTAFQIVNNEIPSGEITSAQEEDIETYLAAHLLSLRDRPASSVSVEGASVTYAGETGMALNSTRYGQMAQVIDPTGTLKELSEGNKIIDTGVGGDL